MGMAHLSGSSFPAELGWRGEGQSNTRVFVETSEWCRVAAAGDLLDPQRVATILPPDFRLFLGPPGSWRAVPEVTVCFPSKLSVVFAGPAQRSWI